MQEKGKKKDSVKEKHISKRKVKKNQNPKEDIVVVEQKGGFNTVEVSCIVVISVIFGVVMGCVLTYGKNHFGSFAVSSFEKELLSTYENILDEYYNSIDEKELMNAAISGMVSALEDPYSSYMDDTVTDDFNQTVEGSYVGIGASVSWEDGKHIIVSLFPNSSALKAGLKEGDVILKIDDKNVQNLSLDEVSKLIKGKIGTKVKVTVLRGEQKKSYTIKRGVVDIPSVSSEIIPNENKKIGYLAIDVFSSNTYSQFEKELISLEKEKISSLILDVRDNPGGHLSQVKQVLELFFDKNTVLYQIEFKNKKQKIVASKKDKRSYPIVVLVNSSSASASEILASCFQENYKNSTIVGTTTYGKGTVQKAIELSSGASVKYTIEKWLTAKGKTIDGKGVNPDVLVDMAQIPFDIQDDVQVQKAIEILMQKKSS